MSNKSDRPSEREAYFTLYLDYARMLRLWLVAYGVGGPVLFLTRADVTRRIVESGEAYTIAVLFLIGVALQILIAVLNKWAAWYVYAGPDDAKARGGWTYRSFRWLSDQFWMDLIFDVGSLILFGWATVKTLLIFAS